MTWLCDDDDDDWKKTFQNLDPAESVRFLKRQAVVFDDDEMLRLRSPCSRELAPWDRLWRTSVIWINDMCNVYQLSDDVLHRALCLHQRLVCERPLGHAKNTMEDIQLKATLALLLSCKWNKVAPNLRDDIVETFKICFRGIKP